MRRTPRSSTPIPEGRDPFEALVVGSVVLLVVLRLLVPPESSVLGQTLWISQLWFAAAALGILVKLRAGRISLRTDLLGAGVGILVLAHVMSALRLVVLEDGNRRSAVNMLWEWLALGVSFPLLRSVLQSEETRRRWTTIFVVLAVATSGLGLYQHYVWFPREVANYVSLRQEYDALRSGDAGDEGNAFSRGQRLMELERQFALLEIPADKAGMRQWEDRLRDSREPFGLFALANTLAGWLLVWLLVGMGLWSANRGRLSGPASRISSRSTQGEGSRSEAAGSGRWRRAIVVLSLAVVAYCLFLTKSRTAWIGMAMGLVTWSGAESWMRRRNVRPASSSPEQRADASESQRGPAEATHRGIAEGDSGRWESGDAAQPGTPSVSRKWRWAAIACGTLTAIVAAGWIAARSGGFDKEVILETPKSFRYRVQYWRGSIAMLRESPVWGVGPGNFQQNYLRHKLPEASEEIADPHNFLFDLWLSGGVLAIVGLGVAIIGACRLVSQSRIITLPPDSGPMSWGASESGALGAFSVLAALDYGLRADTFSSGRILALGVGWLVLMRISGGFLRRSEASRACLLGAVVALGLHLSASGGAEMPAVVQTAFLLVILLSAGVSTPARPMPVSGQRAVATVGIVALGGLFAGCLLTGSIPVFHRDLSQLEGDLLLVQGRAEGPYRRAAESDPLSPEPFDRLAAATSSARGASLDRARFERAIAHQDESIARDPRNSVRFQRRAAIQMEAYRSTGDRGFLDAAIESYRRAIDLYPQFSRIRAEHSRVLRLAGRAEEAEREARKALELDAINRKARHWDKVLPEETVRELEAGGS